LNTETQYRTEFAQNNTRKKNTEPNAEFAQKNTQKQYIEADTDFVQKENGNITQNKTKKNCTKQNTGKR